MAVSNLKERQRQVREEVILEVAHELLAQQGYTAMSMDEVTARVGISKATLYQHFSSKEELAVSVVVRTMRQGEERLDTQDQALPAIVRVEGMLRETLEKRAGLWAINFGPLPPNVADYPQYLAQKQSLLDKLACLIEQAKVEGDLNPGLATPVIVGLVHRLFRDRYDDLLANDLCTQQELCRTIIAVLMDGLKKSHS